MQTEGQTELKKRDIGTPQGGVFSQLLANLFLHYAFDRWMGRQYWYRPFERYADDIVCHCSTMKEAVHLREELQKRFQSVGLTINEAKSKIVYIDTFDRFNVDTYFTFAENLGNGALAE